MVKTMTLLRPVPTCVAVLRRVSRVASGWMPCPWLLLLVASFAMQASAQTLLNSPSYFGEGNRVVLIGGTTAERMQHFGYFETLLAVRYADHALTFRNLAWSGDEVDLRPRPLNFGTVQVHLAQQRPDVVLVFFGLNESFAGEAGLDEYREGLRRLVLDIRSQRFNGIAPPRVVLVSPTAQERVDGVAVDVGRRNRDIALYALAMEELAEELGVGFVDMFRPTLSIVSQSGRNLTFNGMHFTRYGQWIMAQLLARGLGVLGASIEPVEALPEDADFEQLRAMIRTKNQKFFYRYRPVNGEYVYGRRRRPFGVVDFPGEMARLDEIIAGEEERIHVFARSMNLPRVFPQREEP